MQWPIERTENMFLELRRVFSGVAGRGWGRLSFDFLVLPFLVAAIMNAAFLARSSPDAHRESFLYFGTLYAFWCGLFGSCQAFNGEVASGEWSYWMLGMRRRICRHYLAHFVVSAFFALIQVSVSLLFLYGLWSLDSVAVPMGLVSETSESGTCFVNQIVALLKGGEAYNLQGLQATMKHFDQLASERNTTWFAFCLKYFALGDIVAVFSGVTLGLLVSSACSTPQLSLTVSVLVVVSCTIFSYVGVKGYGNSEGDVREFAPVSLILRQQGKQFPKAATGGRCPQFQSRWRDGGSVEMASFLLPQRYFFNIARVPCLNLEYSLGRGIDSDGRTWHDPERLVEHSKVFANGCKCPVCLGLVHVDFMDGNPMVVNEAGARIPLENHWMAAGRSGGWKDALFSNLEWKHPNAFASAICENRGGVRELFSLCSRMAWTEASVAGFCCFLHFLFTLSFIHNKEMFRELR